MMDKTPEELAGEMGQWASLPGGQARLPLMDKQIEALVKLRDALLAVVEKDQVALDRLHEQLRRLEHGGGDHAGH